MLPKTVFIFLFSLLVLTGHCAAQEETLPPAESQKQQPVEEGKEGLSLPRKIAGFTVLGILIIWLFTRGAGKENDEQDDVFGTADTGDDE